MSPRVRTPARAAADSAPALDTDSSSSAISFDSSPIDSFVPWMPLVVLAWMCGVVVLSLRLASGWLWVQAMKRHRASAAADHWRQTVRKLARQLHIRRSIRLLESRAVGVPTVIGWLRPVVLLPVSTLAALSPQQVEAILAHELAHIRRHDYLVNLLQTLVETLLFYHPAVWWLSRRIRIERENCCDDLAVSLCGDPYAYAKALADLEAVRVTSGRLALAATGGSLLQRVRRLVAAPARVGRRPGWAAGFAALLLMTGVAAGAIGNELFLHDGRTFLGANGRSWDVDRASLDLRVHDAADAIDVLRGAKGATRAFAEGARDATRALLEGARDATRALAGGARDASRAVAGGARDARRKRVASSPRQRNALSDTRAVAGTSSVGSGESASRARARRGG
jgi:beta-lactamase regulating signal transducer with metallopeptidase domain